MYISGDLGYWDLGTSNIFYGTGIPGSPFATAFPVADPEALTGSVPIGRQFLQDLAWSGCASAWYRWVAR